MKKLHERIQDACVDYFQTVSREQFIKDLESVGLIVIDLKATPPDENYEEDLNKHGAELLRLNDIGIVQYWE